MKNLLSLTEMLNIMRYMLDKEENWNCDLLVILLYIAQLKKAEIKINIKKLEEKLGYRLPEICENFIEGRLYENKEM
jgi:hypothetical protein